MDSTLTLLYRLTLTDFAGRNILADSRVGIPMAEAASITRKNSDVTQPIPLGPVTTFLSVIADGEFYLVLTSGTDSVRVKCNKLFLTYAAYDSVVIEPLLPLPTKVTSAQITYA